MGALVCTGESPCWIVPYAEVTDSAPGLMGPPAAPALFELDVCTNPPDADALLVTIPRPDTFDVCDEWLTRAILLDEDSLVLFCFGFQENFRVVDLGKPSFAAWLDAVVVTVEVDVRVALVVCPYVFSVVVVVTEGFTTSIDCRCCAVGTTIDWSVMGR